jgi:putative flippase GtrA
VSRLGDYLFVRHAHNWVLLLKFGLVGASGVLVNLLVLVLVHPLGPPEATVLSGPLHWYHLYSTAAFAVANLWNFQLNRRWAFCTTGNCSWLREYLPFLAVGLLGQLLTLLLLTLLMHPGSVLELPVSVLDDSSGWRTRLYWAQLATIGVVTPLSFVLNKVWTFRVVRAASRPTPRPPLEPPASEPQRSTAAAEQLVR